eukprot:8109535-Alexandrium_andersonii.AAC.1
MRPRAASARRRIGQGRGVEGVSGDALQQLRTRGPRAARWVRFRGGSVRVCGGPIVRRRSTVCLGLLRGGE